MIDVDLLAEVMRAFYAGKTIQVSYNSGEWYDKTYRDSHNHIWTPASRQYRIKPDLRTFQLCRPVYENKTIKEPWRVVEGKHEYINPHHERIVVQEVMEE